MAVCKIEIARVWSILLKPVQPVKPVSDFKSYIAYQQQNSQHKTIVPGFGEILQEKLGGMSSGTR